MIVQHNMSAMNTNRELGVSTGKLAKSTEKLSSGYRINRAADDAAGLAISEKMRGQIRGLNQASTNAEDGISLIQTGEGALQESQNILQRMRELSVQAANDTNTDDDRTQIQNEITQLTQEVDRIANTSEFNTKKLINGDQAGSTVFKAGKAKIEGTFQNGMVVTKALATSVAQLVGTDDVIRITINKDTVSNSISSGGYSVESLNGKGAGVKISTGSVVISGAAKGSKTATGVTANLTFSISGFSNLKAGDVITISLSKVTTPSAAVAGKESLRIQAGANAGQEVSLAIGDMRASALGIVQTAGTDLAGGTAPTGNGMPLDVTTQSNASMATEAFDKALEKVSTERAKLGAVQNRLEHTISNLDTSGENLQAAESRIRDVDMADEMTQYSKENILMQAGQSMLAQANQSTQGVLSLLQG
ncbi:MAG: flagellin [Acetivibrio sp.]